MQRKGLQGVNYRVLIEVVGSLAIVIILALVVAHYLGVEGGGSDCSQYGTEPECVQQDQCTWETASLPTESSPGQCVAAGESSTSSDGT